MTEYNEDGWFMCVHACVRAYVHNGMNACSLIRSARLVMHHVMSYVSCVIFIADMFAQLEAEAAKSVAHVDDALLEECDDVDALLERHNHNHNHTGPGLTKGPTANADADVDAILRSNHAIIASNDHDEHDEDAFMRDQAALLKSLGLDAPNDHDVQSDLEYMRG